MTQTEGGPPSSHLDIAIDINIYVQFKTFHMVKICSEVNCVVSKIQLIVVSYALYKGLNLNMYVQNVA